MGERAAAVDGLLAAGAQVAAGELAAALLPGARSPLTGLGRTLIDLTPGPVVDVTIALFEARDKPLLMGNVLGGLGAAGVAAGRLRARHPLLARVLLGGGALAAGAGAASRPDSATGASAVAGAAGAAVGVGALELLARRRSLPVRAVVAGGSVGAGLAARRRRRAAVTALAEQRLGVRLPAPESALPAPPASASVAVAGVSSLLTPTESFYETDVTFPPPVVDVESWRLRVHGLVEEPLELSFDELVALGTVERDTTLVCVHNPVGGPRIGTARWLGVPVARLLAQAGVRPGADQLLARSIDGFTAGVPVAMVGEERAAMVVVGMNGAPLPVGHGFPARLLTPGLYGYDANTKWLAELELTTFDSVADYWTQRGWPREPAHVRPAARIDVPRDRHTVAAGELAVAGVAWAPPAGVTGVEVSVDGGDWQPAQLAGELDPAAWRQWSFRAELPPGRHSLRARVTGQEEEGAPPFPRGAGGFHTIEVDAGDTAAAPRALAAVRTVAGRRGRLAAQGAGSWARNHRRARG